MVGIIAQVPPCPIHAVRLCGRDDSIDVTCRLIVTRFSLHSRQTETLPADHRDHADVRDIQALVGSGRVGMDHTHADDFCHDSVGKIIIFRQFFKSAEL